MKGLPPFHKSWSKMEGGPLQVGPPLAVVGQEMMMKSELQFCKIAAAPLLLLPPSLSVLDPLGLCNPFFSDFYVSELDFNLFLLTDWDLRFYVVT